MSGPTWRQRSKTWRDTAEFGAQLARLRADRAIGRRRPRVLATACWHFPIYSQTFVYQELTQLVKSGVELRFLYSELTADDLPSQFRPVWDARRRLPLHAEVCEASVAWFAARAPERVARLVSLLADASGLTADQIRAHYHFRQAFAFARFADAYAPDYLHSYFFYEGTLFALVASLLLDIPRGVSCYADHMLDDYALKVVGLHLRQTSLVIATSQRIKTELLAIEPQAAADQILVKPNGINTARFPRTDRTGPAPDQPLRLVCVSRIEPKKGLVYLVEAVGLLRDRGVPAELHVIGGVDQTDASRQCDRELRARVAALRLETQVHLVGRQTEDEINAVFRSAHAFVAPFVETAAGDKDGVPTALLEAMASGLPIVATDAGSILEVIEHGVDGLIVPQRNPDALAGALAALRDDSDRRGALGQRAAHTARTRFDATVTERTFHTRLRETLAARRSAVLESPLTESNRG